MHFLAFLFFTFCVSSFFSDYGLFDNFECFVFIDISLCVREIDILDVDVVVVINFYFGGTFLFSFLGGVRNVILIMKTEKGK